MKKAVVVFSGVLVFLISWGLDQREPGSLAEGRKPAQEIGSSSLKIDWNFGKMPVCFIPNRGQMDERVAFYVQGKDKTIYFTPQGLTIALAGSKPDAPSLTSPLFQRGDRRRIDSPLTLPLKEEGNVLRGEAALRENAPSERWVVKLDFVGANPDVHPEGLGETGAKISYFKGKPSEWRTGLPAYSKLIYRDLWPGIDLVYDGTVNRLKYEFIVHPGADPSQIRLSYRGAESVSVDSEGRLQVTTPMGRFKDDAPAAYQEINGKRTDVKLAYRLDAEACSYGFELGKYDRTRPLILDPAILIYCGYIGGSNFERERAIAVDSAGCAYVTGRTDSSEATFPAIVGPDLTFNTNEDAFVAKVNAAGTGLIYCGYIGGASAEEGYGIAVDSAGCAYVTGETWWPSQSTFPATVGPDLTHNGSIDAYVAKVSASGTALIYCGYIGGYWYDWAYGIAVDSAGCAYVTGGTGSSQLNTFPVTVGPDLTHNGVYDAYVAKVDASGKGLIYCGYIGGAGHDHGKGIAVDNAGCAYVTGYTTSSEATFPVKVGPDLTYSGAYYNDLDAYVAKVNASGTGLIYCGYIGGGGDDIGNGIAVDGAGAAYVTGYTSSTEDSFPVTVGPDLTHGEQGAWYDAFVAKVHASGSGFIYCGYIGGSGHDSGNGIAVDRAGCAYVAGESSSNEDTLPVTMGPDLTYNGLFDAFVAKVDAFGRGLIYCGYIGGYGSGDRMDGLDKAYGIAVDGAGAAYIAGYTFSKSEESEHGATFPATVGPDLTYNGRGDAFVAKISPEYFGYYVFDSHDYDGDGDSDIAVWRPSNGYWYLWRIDNDPWGRVNDIPVPGDYNSDGITDLAVWRPSDGVWYIRKIDNDPFGQVGDVPVPADYDGDGRTDLAVWRPSDGTWRIRYRAGGDKVKPWGIVGDFPVPGDYNGDGVADLAVWRPSNGLWYIKGVDTDLLGQDGDIPVPADYDGDGKTDLAVWRPADGIWRIRFRKGGGKTKLWGIPGDVPVPGDYNGDGIADLAVWRPGTGQWLIHKIDIITWGAAGDIPLVR